MHSTLNSVPYYASRSEIKARPCDDGTRALGLVLIMLSSATTMYMLRTGANERQRLNRK